MDLPPMTPEYQPLKSNPKKLLTTVTVAIYSEPSSQARAPHLQGGAPTSNPAGRL